MQEQTRQIGLIAGNGRLPFLFARAAARQNKKVVAAAVKGDTSYFLRFYVDEIAWFQAGELRKLFDYFKYSGIRQVIMAGQVNPVHLFNGRTRMDQEFQKLFEALENRKADTIFSAVGQQLYAQGMELLDSTTFLKDYLAPKGTLSRRALREDELADVVFGTQIAKSMGGLDVGQTVIVKRKAIVAIEALEGTDRCILRGGRIVQRDAVVVKTSKPQQDQRFDVPVVGPRTIRTMGRCRAGCLAIEAGKTLVIDLEQCLKLADKFDIAIVAV